MWAYFQNSLTIRLISKFVISSYCLKCFDTWFSSRKGIWPVKTEWWSAGVVICLERGADLHVAQLMTLPLTVSCFSKIQIGFTFLVLANPGSPDKGPLNRCVCVCHISISHHTLSMSLHHIVKYLCWKNGSAQEVIEANCCVRLRCLKTLLKYLCGKMSNM